MPIFIALSLTLGFLAQTASPLQNLLIAPAFIGVGLALAIISIAGSLFKKLPITIYYDLFASGTLLIWFANWKTLFFKDDSPVFYAYPLYFAFMTAFVSLFFINQRHKMDVENFRQMQALSAKSKLQPWLVMTTTLLSLALPEHYMLYPTIMTLLIFRFALSRCLEP
jgi:hypothetical protein